MGRIVGPARAEFLCRTTVAALLWLPLNALLGALQGVQEVIIWWLEVLRLDRQVRCAAAAGEHVFTAPIT